MDDRETVVLKQIIHFQVSKSFELERKLNLTPRQLSYSLKKINIELKRNNLSSITRSNSGQFFIPNESKNFLEKQIQNIPDTNRYFNEDQRMYLIILYLLTSGEIVSLVHIYEFLNVRQIVKFKLNI
ncbi:hypothetical protein ATN91_09755 [Companilactobacillus kimchii]|nr:hypothetical protein ATN91_09755 [Companilactobacillus kimchii]